jgi:hypothetical protein
MKARPKSRKQRVQPKSKRYGYKVLYSFNIQFSFAESDVEQDSEGNKGDFSPTGAAIRALEKELSNVLGQNYAVSDFEAYTDSDDLLGISEG